MIGKKLLSRKKTIISQLKPASRYAEQYRILRTNIQFSTRNEGIQTILVTSSARGEGKTTTVANLGTVLAQQGRKVLLIDTDFRNPELHQFFGEENYNGLTEILLNDYSLEEVVISTSVKNLDIIASGHNLQFESDFLGTNKTNLFLEKIKGIYDVVLFDSPPIIESADAQVLANFCDGSILVTKRMKTKKDKLTIAKNNLEKSKAKLLGAVLNEKKYSKFLA